MARRRAVFVALGVAVSLYLATLPWQQRQWAGAARARRQAALQESRANAIVKARDKLAHAEAQIRASPDDVEARLTAARALADRRDISRAAAHLRAVERAAESSPELAGVLFSLYQQIGYFDRALAMARLEQRLAPDSSSALLNLGFLHLQLGWQEQVGDFFRQAARRAPDSAEPHLALALWYGQSASDWKAAEKELAIADRLRPGDWQIALLVAQNLLAQKRYQDTLNAIEAGVRRDPTQPQLYAQQAQALYEQARAAPQTAGTAAFGRTVRAARQCLFLDPGNADARFVLGKAYADLGDEESAVREWERLYQNAPDYPKLRLNLGRLLARPGNSNADRARGLRMLADARRRQMEHEAFNRLVILAGGAPDDVQRRRELARWCQAHGRLSRAILEWEQVLARLPGDGEARRALVQAKRQRGDL